MIRHIVAVNFKEDATEDQKAEVMEALAALRGHLDGILDFQVRENISPEEPVVHGFYDMFWFDFADETSRDAYLVDPEHKAAGAKLVGLAEDGPNGILVLDFEV